MCGKSRRILHRSCERLPSNSRHRKRCADTRLAGTLAVVAEKMATACPARGRDGREYRASPGLRKLANAQMVWPLRHVAALLVVQLLAEELAVRVVEARHHVAAALLVFELEARMSAELLDEHRYPGVAALFHRFRSPLDVEGARSVPALAADDQPVEPRRIGVAAERRDAAVAHLAFQERPEAH